MSTLEVNEPYITGAPGRTSCVSATPASTSAFISVSAPASVAGAIAPASVNGVTHTAWFASASSVRPSAIGMSRLSGELVLTIASTAGIGGEAVTVGAERDRRDVDRVGRPLTAEGDALPVLVEQAGQRRQQVEMAGLGRQVHRLERPATLLVDDVERLDQAQVVALLGERAGPSAAVEVRAERRAADRREHHMAVADHQVVGRVASAQRERRRRRGDRLDDHVGVEPDAILDHGAARCAQPFASARFEHPHPGVAKQPQRCIVDRLDLVGRQDLGRCEVVDDVGPRELGDLAPPPTRPIRSLTCHPGHHRASPDRFHKDHVGTQEPSANCTACDLAPIATRTHCRPRDSDHETPTTRLRPRDSDHDHFRPDRDGDTFAQPPT